jgi:hypothetical protein
MATGSRLAAVLGPFFFASYGFATWISSQRPDVGFIVFAWERTDSATAMDDRPLLADRPALWPLATAVHDRRQLDTHACRLLLTQLLAVSCFLLFPLRCTFERGEVAGAFGWPFAVLMTFDQPFNQAPSLHIALLVVLLEPYLRAFRAPGTRWSCHGLADRRVGIDHLATPLLRHPDRPVAGLLACSGCFPPTPARRCGERR